MQETLQQYQDLVQRLETVVQSETEVDPTLAKGAAGDEPPLQVILHNVYRYLMAVAANLDRLHEAVSDARHTFLTARQQVPAFWPSTCCSSSCCACPSLQVTAVAGPNLA